MFVEEEILRVIRIGFGRLPCSFYPPDVCMPREICKEGPPMQPVVVLTGGGAALSRLHLILHCRMMCIDAAICIGVLIIHAFVTAFRITHAYLRLTAVDLPNT